MLQFADNMANQHRYGGGNNIASDNDQMADFCGIDDLVDQDELNEVEHLHNPKAKTTNMSSLLK